MPVKIASQRKKKIAVSLPYQESNKNGVKKTKLYFPVRKVFRIDHTGDQRNSNTKKRNKYKAETDIVQPELKSILFYRLYFIIGRHFFRVRSLCLCTVKIRK